MPALALLALTAVVGTTTPDDPLQPLDFLQGSWVGAVDDGSGDTFKRELNGHVLVRHATSATRNAEGKTVGTLAGTMTVHPSGDHQELRAVYFDSEGHVIHFRSETVEPGKSVRFVSDGSDPGPTFRLTYRLTAPKLLHVAFEMAPPGQATFAMLGEGDERQTP